MSSSINRRIAVGAAWMVVMRVADRIIGLLSISILARLLLPTDFGLVAYAMVFLAIPGGDHALCLAQRARPARRPWAIARRL